MKKTAFALLIICLAGCFPVKKLPYAPPPVEDPFPETIMGLNAIKNFRSAEDMKKGTPAASLVRVDYSKEEFRKFGTALPVFNGCELNGVESASIFFTHIRKITDDDGSAELAAGKIYLSALNMYGYTFNAEEFKKAGFPEKFRYDQKRGMIVIAEDAVFADSKTEKEEEPAE